MGHQWSMGTSRIQPCLARRISLFDGVVCGDKVYGAVVAVENELTAQLAEIKKIVRTEQHDWP